MTNQDRQPWPDRVEALHRGRWGGPSDGARRLVRALPPRVALPPSPAAGAPALAWSPADVRGVAPTETVGTRLESQSFPGAVVGMFVAAPEGDGRWEIVGRVWLDRPEPGAIRVVLVHEDHVLAVLDTEDGGSFRLEEVMGPGWHLEIHLPDGRTILVREPAP